MVRRATGFVGRGGDWRDASIVSVTARACGALAFVASLAVPPSHPRGDDAYRVLVRHTYGCAACPTAVRLTRAWRGARR
ncbi:hypothetical protein GA0115254_111018 [Streptomyces sp. Ncost-T10-10d]|nr:hypothetical protein GA0115254_111018 [Streptomyces sp. Ncost-T10-10d]